MTTDRPDPSSISDRTEFAAALRAIRTEAGATVREIVERSGGLHGTISGWFSGHHVPTKASAEMFSAVLAACGVDEEDERASWWDAVSRVRSIPGRRTVDPVKGDPPYKGLEAFESADAEWFFGRDDVIEQLGVRVRDALDSGGGIVFVVGASGSGKSSLLRAGLASRFPGTEVHSGIGAIRAFPERMGLFAPGSVLVLDQAEELWTLASAGERESFLRAASALPNSESVLVVGLRADFYQNAVSEDALLAGLSDNPVVVGRLTETQLREVIVSPAAKAGVTVDEALVQVLVGELGSAWITIRPRLGCPAVALACAADDVAGVERQDADSRGLSRDRRDRRCGGAKRGGSVLGSDRRTATRSTTHLHASGQPRRRCGDSSSRRSCRAVLRKRERRRRHRRRCRGRAVCRAQTADCRRRDGPGDPRGVAHGVAAAG
ncbi:ATP-binding protein [Rhodococcus yunnanensis]|uniref:ATP-binding protein n=1 Tax=Rhodococcoides yunnanense TaxID=278209 RepID=A0ABU4BH10_9NOCA|nr:ATP-binding protein [Rhodococcus yunnanensis]MDV6263478.1 ATP-binding protein [Rhodococcus yunnanensis]